MVGTDNLSRSRSILSSHSQPGPSAQSRKVRHSSRDRGCGLTMSLEESTPILLMAKIVDWQNGTIYTGDQLVACAST